MSVNAGEIEASGWVSATLGLGGNIGDPVAAMAEALRQLDQSPSCRVVSVSNVYSTPPWGNTDQADFFNCCAQIQTELQPEALLDLCLAIERGLKRVRIERWGPRTIDIDILTYADVSRITKRLELPHPRMTERAFVLVPLADVAADLMVAGRTVSAWRHLVDASGIVQVGDAAGWWQKTSAGEE